ncbi:MAG: PGAP1-like family protein [Steroidobacteraceae bacterium]|nr:PGAP1-like family protein [Steroidobacteraceae bacterium]
MTGLTRTRVSDARGAGRMLLDASVGVVDVVERMHRTIQRRPGPLGEPIAEATRGITGFVYRSIRGTMQLAARGLDASLAPLERLLPDAATTPGRDVYLSIVNGVYGDHLARTGNPLAIEMRLLHDGVTLDASSPASHFACAGRPAPTGKLLVFVHGLCMSVQQWSNEGYSHGAALADAFGYTPLYLRYNSGLHVADNGRLFAELLEALLAGWPCGVDELTIVGHSMGGLVARSACLAGGEHGHRWPAQLRTLVFLGTPHHGAPLERGGHGLDYLLDLSPYSAPFTRLGRARSAGIRDLRHGTITSGPHRVVPLPSGVNCYAVAASLGARANMLADHVIGDGLVPLNSALGRHADPKRSLQLPRAHTWVGYQMGHLELLHRPEVYAQLRSWLATPAA